APGNQATLGRAGEPQRARRLPAHAFGVADAHPFGAGGDVEADRAVRIVNASAGVQRAAADLRGEILEIQPGSVENQVAFDAAQSGRKIDGPRLRVFDVNLAGDARTIERPFKSGVHLRRAARVETRHETAQQAQVEGAVQVQADVAPSGELHV